MLCLGVFPQRLGQEGLVGCLPTVLETLDCGLFLRIEVGTVGRVREPFLTFGIGDRSLWCGARWLGRGSESSWKIFLGTVPLTWGRKPCIVTVYVYFVYTRLDCLEQSIGIQDRS